MGIRNYKVKSVEKGKSGKSEVKMWVQTNPNTQDYEDILHQSIHFSN